jgi:hypothetical protein
MKNFNVIRLSVLFAVSAFMGSCSIVGGIFKTGMGVGIFIAVVVVAIIVALALRGGKK